MQNWRSLIFIPVEVKYWAILEMDILQIVLSLSAKINALLDLVASIVFWVGLVLLLFRYISKSINKEGVGKGLYMGAVAVFAAGILVIFICFFLPRSLVFLSRSTLELVTARWITLYLVAMVWSYRVSYKASGWRGVSFVILILTTLLFGWLYDRWIGIIALSVPVLLIYSYIIYKVAQVVLPASNPEDKDESWKKAQAFLVYLLGVQHPIWMAKESTGRVLEKRVEGNATNEIGKPGIIWTWSHQVAGVSKGVGFTRVDGPGLIFTAPFEAPVELVDLRMQSRVSTVNTVTKDGIDIPTVVFAAFAIDKRNSAAQPARRRHTNGDNFNIDHGQGSFPYSSGRVLATLGTTGVNNPRRGEFKEKHELVWDEWVVSQIEHVTRLVVAERSLDELWRPKQDDLGVSALTEIATRLQELLAPSFSEVGINLITVRIVNYQLSEEHKIVKQNLKIWSSYWEQQIAEANADIEMIYRDEIEKAHAYSKSILLSAIADSINKARSINEDLPRHVIAQYFIHALEEYIKGQPGLNISESKKQLETVREILMNNRMEGNE